MNKQEFIAYLEGYRDATSDLDMFDDIIAKAQELELTFTTSPDYPVWPPTIWPNTCIDVVRDLGNWGILNTGDGSWSVKKGS